MNRKYLVLKAVLAVLAIFAVPARAHDNHDHASYVAGEPGDAKQPARTIEIAMNEMVFDPSMIAVRRGEQIRFVLRNDGSQDHEFLLATTKENLQHAEMMKMHPDMVHTDANGVRLRPKATAEIVWRFTKAGTFEFACLIPGHREAGMVGRVTVK